MEVKKTNDGFIIDGKEYSRDKIIDAGMEKLHRNPNRRRHIGEIDDDRDKKSESWLKGYLDKLKGKDS